ncbi:barstar family protein [Streptomyces xanthophaeus]
MAANGAGEADGEGRGRARYTLTGAEDGQVWGVCAEAEGLFGTPWRHGYALSGWVPEGAGISGWTGHEVWWVPQDAALGPWLLQDAESLDHFLDADGPVLIGRDGHDDPPQAHGGAVRLHDGRRWLGTCREFTRVLPPRPVEAPVLLRGTAPGDELRRTLETAPRLPLDLGEAVLSVRDGRGEPFAELRLWVTVSAWHPSVHGAGLIDLELEGKLSVPVPEQARPLWEHWLAGPSRTPGAWAGLDTRQRRAWLDHVRERRVRPAPDGRASGRSHTLDGRHVTDVPGLYLALGEAVNGPGGYLGGCPSSLADCLGGSSGYTAPGTLLWRDAATAREHLSNALEPDGRPYDLFGEVLGILAEFRMRVVLA